MKLSREIPVLGSFDILICGAGPAGICAAMSAARMGHSVALVERFGVVGGNLTHGHVGPIMGRVSKGTMAEELGEVLAAPKGIFLDVEQAKISLMKWIDHPNITLFTNTPVSDIIVEQNEVCGIVVSTQSGLAALYGKITVDATGDGVVAYLAGAKTHMGRDSDGLVQPVTIMFTLSGIDPCQKILCRHEEDDTLLENGSYFELTKRACAEGKLPENVGIVRLYATKHPDERVVNATQANKINGLNPLEITIAQKELRRQSELVVNFLRENVKGFENCRIKDSSDIAGIRETRRVEGAYTLCDDDLMCGRRFDDAIVHNAYFCIDIHNPSGAGQSESHSRPQNPKPYDIPYRCFVPNGIQGLYTAGRCISGTHRAHASYRVMNICMAMGEAVGISAALCVEGSVSPNQLDAKLVREKLIHQGVELIN